LASHDLPLAANQLSLAQLNERSREIFRRIVESYLATGEPVGSRNLSRILPMTLSPASVRNVMADLEQLGIGDLPARAVLSLPPRREREADEEAVDALEFAKEKSAGAHRGQGVPPSAVTSLTSAMGSENEFTCA